MKKKLYIMLSLLLCLALSTFIFMGFTPMDSMYPTMTKAMGSSTTMWAALLNADGTDSGKGFIARESGKLYYYAVAALPEPPMGMFYEGWIVSDAGDKMSTGKLEKNADGNWEVAFMSDMMMEGYNTIVITSETKMDGMPETVVLKGDASMHNMDMMMDMMNSDM